MFKSFLIIVLSLVLASVAFAQDPCKQLQGKAYKDCRDAQKKGNTTQQNIQKPKSLVGSTNPCKHLQGRAYKDCRDAQKKGNTTQQKRSPVIEKANKKIPSVGSVLSNVPGGKSSVKVFNKAVDKTSDAGQKGFGNAVDMTKKGIKAWQNDFTKRLGK